MLKGLSLDELHRIEITASGSAQVEDRGDIRVAHTGRRTRLAQETKPSRFVAQISFANNLQGYRTTQINVEGLVGDTHCPTTQLDRSAIVIQHHLIVLKPPSLRPSVSLLSAASCQFPGHCSFRAESSAQNTNWAELPVGSGEELRAADRTRTSCCTNSGSLPGSSTDPPDSAFTASAFL
jgi:hypothetical protein